MPIHADNNVGKGCRTSIHLLFSESIYRATSKEVVGHYRASFCTVWKRQYSASKKVIECYRETYCQYSTSKKVVECYRATYCSACKRLRRLLNVLMHRFVLPGNVYMASSKVVANRNSPSSCTDWKSLYGGLRGCWSSAVLPLWVSNVSLFTDVVVYCTHIPTHSLTHSLTLSIA